MAEDCIHNPPDGFDTTVNVPNINYFSNPDVNYEGTPTGTDSEDNARAIRERMVRLKDVTPYVVPPLKAATAFDTLLVLLCCTPNARRCKILSTRVPINHYYVGCRNLSITTIAVPDYMPFPPKPDISLQVVVSNYRVRENR